MGCPENRVGQRLSLFKATLLDTKTQSSKQKKSKVKNARKDPNMPCFPAQRVERVLWRKYQQAAASRLDTVWTHRSFSPIEGCQESRGRPTPSLASTDQALGLRNDPVKTEACGAKAKLRGECLRIWSPPYANTRLGVASFCTPGFERVCFWLYAPTRKIYVTSQEETNYSSNSRRDTAYSSPSWAMTCVGLALFGAKCAFCAATGKVTVHRPIFIETYLWLRLPYLSKPVLSVCAATAALVIGHSDPLLIQLLRRCAGFHLHPSGFSPFFFLRASGVESLLYTKTLRLQYL